MKVHKYPHKIYAYINFIDKLYIITYMYKLLPKLVRKYHYKRYNTS